MAEDRVVTIKLEALRRGGAGGRLEMPLTGPATVCDAIEYVREKNPGLSFDNDSVIVTINDKLVPLERPLKAGDIMNILPVIEGG